MEKPRILIIDDSVNLTLLYKQELEDTGYSVDITNSYKTAIEYINEQLYDLIIVETKLKDIKDYNKLQAKINDNPVLPVIINTVSHNLNNESTLWSINSDACVVKSSDVSVLKGKIELLLNGFGLLH